MKSLNDYRIRLMLVGVVGVIVLGVGTAKADFTFGEPTNLGPVVNFSPWHQSPFISADGLSLYFSGGPASEDLWMTERDSVHDDWGKPTNLGPPINTSLHEFSPSISPDGLELYFNDAASSWGYTPRPGGLGECDIWVSTRPTQDQPWTEPKNLGPVVNSQSIDGRAKISFDGLILYFSSDRPRGFGGEDIWVTQRESKLDSWGEPVNLGPVVNSSAYENGPSLSADGLALFFNSNRPGGYGLDDLYMTTRATINDPWGIPVNLGPTVNTVYGEVTPCISADGLTLYFGEFPNPRPGGFGRRNIWQTSLIPIVDLNGDGIVDSVDLCIIVDNWGTNYSLCDIGPMPWGDGIVDVQDLIVLAEHLFEEIFPLGLVEYWKLDETEGMFAVDSVSNNDAIVVGGAVWQPSSGQVDGALQLNSVDGCAIAGAVLNPADGPFSIFAWINGGAPGQVVVSQQGASDWLAADAEGNLMTELKGTGRSAGPLYSETVITDGQWHRVGLVWDGSHRTLYVDGVEVADDIQPGLEGSQMGLYIGTGKAMEPGTYFSGLIDDVRIYNRVVSP
ncbi:LamG-like jellyroll fold domain-containing protein [Planctomycetota bacterium]